MEMTQTRTQFPTLFEILADHRYFKGLLNLLDVELRKKHRGKYHQPDVTRMHE